MSKDVICPPEEKNEHWTEEISTNPKSGFSKEAEAFGNWMLEKVDRQLAKKEKLEKKEKEEIIKEFKPIHISELSNADYGEYKYIIKNLIPREGITLISASPKSGKTLFVLYIMLQIAKGEPVFELETTKSRILLIDEENTFRGLKRRLEKLTDSLEGVDITLLNKNNFKLDLEVDRNWLKEYIKNNAIEVVVFDSFRRIHSQEENTSDGIAKVYDYLKDVMTTGVAIVLIDHNRKLGQFEKISMESIRGSSDKYAMAEAVILLQTKDLTEKIATGKVKRTIVMPELRESAELKNFAFHWFDSENGSKIVFDYKGSVKEEQLKKDRAKELIMQIIEEENQRETVKTLQAKLKPQGIGEKTIREALKELTINGSITETPGTGKQRNTKFYSKSKESLLGSSLYNDAELPSNSEESFSLE